MHRLDPNVTTSGPFSFILNTALLKQLLSENVCFPFHGLLIVFESNLIEHFISSSIALSILHFEFKVMFSDKRIYL